MNTPTKAAVAAVTAAAVAFTAGCGSTYDERINYLRLTAQRGAAMHTYLAAQEATIDKARCERAYEGSRAWADAPADGGTTLSDEWRAQIQEFYVDSCLSGKPKAVPGDVLPSGSASPGPSPASSPSAG